MLRHIAPNAAVDLERILGPVYIQANRPTRERIDYTLPSALLSRGRERIGRRLRLSRSYRRARVRARPRTIATRLSSSASSAHHPIFELAGRDLRLAPSRPHRRAIARPAQIGDDRGKTAGQTIPHRRRRLAARDKLQLHGQIGASGATRHTSPRSPGRPARYSPPARARRRSAASDRTPPRSTAPPAITNRAPGISLHASSANASITVAMPFASLHRIKAHDQRT